jgi:hypothetical protein
MAITSPLERLTDTDGTPPKELSPPRISLYESFPETEKFPLCPDLGVATYLPAPMSWPPTLQVPAD